MQPQGQNEIAWDNTLPCVPPVHATHMERPAAALAQQQPGGLLGEACMGSHQQDQQDQQGPQQHAEEGGGDTAAATTRLADGAAAAAAEAVAPVAEAVAADSAAAVAEAVASSAAAVASAAAAAAVQTLRCPLCSHLVTAAVQLRPCCHRFCAACVSQHLGAQLQGGVPLACPFGCPLLHSVVADHAARSKAKRLLSQGRDCCHMLCEDNNSTSHTHPQPQHSSLPGGQPEAAAEIGCHCAAPNSNPTDPGPGRHNGHPPTQHLPSRPLPSEAGAAALAASSLPPPDASDPTSTSTSTSPPLPSKALSAAEGHGVPLDPNTRCLDLLTRLAAKDLQATEWQERANRGAGPGGETGDGPGGAAAAAWRGGLRRHGTGQEVGGTGSDGEWEEDEGQLACESGGSSLSASSSDGDARDVAGDASRPSSPAAASPPPPPAAACRDAGASAAVAAATAETTAQQQPDLPPTGPTHSQEPHQASTSCIAAVEPVEPTQPPNPPTPGTPPPGPPATAGGAGATAPAAPGRILPARTRTRSRTRCRSAADAWAQPSPPPFAVAARLHAAATPASGQEQDADAAPGRSQNGPAAVPAETVHFSGGPSEPPMATATSGEASTSPHAHGSSSCAPPLPPSMSLLCPLHDEDLPLDVASLKSDQVQNSLMVLRDQMGVAKACGPATCCRSSCAAALEALARLAWSDDEVREMVAVAGGVRLLLEVLRVLQACAPAQVMACLALMAMVRGEGELCQATQWGIAKACGVEVIAQAMDLHADSVMVQAAAVLCLIPLTLDNAMMQAHLSRVALGSVLRALRRFPDDAMLQAKGLVLCGVMVEGAEALQEAVRQRLVEEGVVGRLLAALSGPAARDDDVLWACLFCMTGLSRDPAPVVAATSPGKTGFRRWGILVAGPPPGLPLAEVLGCRQAVTLAAQGGMLPLLRRCASAYRERAIAAAAAEGGCGTVDDMVEGAGGYVIGLLEREEGRQRRRRRVAVQATALVLGGVCAGAAAAAWWRLGGCPRGQTVQSGT